MPSSPPMKMKTGFNFRFINPEGSLNHKAPTVVMWKMIVKTDPRNEDNKFEYYKLFNAPYSTNINGGESLRHYSSKGWKLFSNCVINGIPYIGFPPPKDWEEKNEEFLAYSRDIRARINPQVAAIDKLTELVTKLVEKESRTADETERLNLMMKDIEQRQKDIKDAIYKNEQDKESGGEGEDESSIQTGEGFDGETDPDLGEREADSAEDD